MRKDEYQQELWKVRIPRSTLVFPGTRPIATAYRTGLSSRKRQFESGRDCCLEPLVNWGSTECVLPPD